MSSTIKPDIPLIRKAAKGDPAAFTQLFHQHFQSIYLYSRSLCSDEMLAEDLTQEAFIQAHLKLNQLGPPWNFKAWLFRLTRNLFLQSVRSEKEVHTLETVKQMQIDTENLEQIVERAESQERVRYVLSHLPLQYREVLELREFHEFAYVEIAGILDVSLNNMKVMLYRARAKFQEFYGLQLFLDEPTALCADVSELLHLAHDRESIGEKKGLVRDHLKTCDVCQQRQKRLVAISGLLGALPPLVPPSGLVDKVLKNTGLPQSTGPQGSTPGPEGAAKGNIIKGGFKMATKNFKWVLFLGGGALVVLVVGFIAFRLLGSPAPAAVLPEDVVPIKVEITGPQGGTESPAGEPLLVLATGFGQEPLLSMQLWANDQLVAVQAAPTSAGITPMSVDFGWIPETPGDYALVARAIDAMQRTADSSPVMVMIGPTEKDDAVEIGSEDPEGAVPIADGTGGEGSPPANVPAVPLPPSSSPPENQGDDPPGDPYVGPVLSVELRDLRPELPADRSYCYRALNGVWARWPEVGFFELGEEGLGLPELESLVFDEGEEPEVLTLDLDCWGWVGGGLVQLGSFHHEFALDDGEQVLTLGDGQLAADVLVDSGQMFPMEGEMGDQLPTHNKLPRVFAIILFGANTCMEHTPSKGENLIENLLFCTWYPAYDEGTQPYLVWFETTEQAYTVCAAGQGSVCATMAQWRTRAAQNGGTLGYNLYWANSGIKVGTFPDGLTAYVVPPPYECGAIVPGLVVRTYYHGGPDDLNLSNTTVESISSNAVTSQPFCPTPKEVTLEVVFDSLEIHNLDDGIGGGDDLEVYGTMLASGQPGTGEVLHVAQSDGDSPCPNDIFSGTLNTQGTMGLGCPELVEDGSNAFSEFEICKGSCSEGYITNNKVVTVTVEGGYIHVSVNLWDYDHSSGNDPVCIGETWVGPQSIFGWMDYTGSAHISQGDNGNASCTVWFHIRPPVEE